MKDPDRLFIYLKLLTISDGTRPLFTYLLVFLYHCWELLLGLMHKCRKNNGTLTRLIAQPVYRDNVLLAKFLEL